VLQLFGVGAQTERVYRAMLASTEADVGQLADELGLTTEQTVAELDRLAQLMLVEPAGPPSHYIAVPPDQAIELLIAQEEARLAERQAEMKRSRADLHDYVETFVESRVTRDGLGLIEQIDDGSVVRSRLYQLVRDATSSVLVQMPGDALPADAVAASSRLDAAVLGRGLLVRFLVSEASARAPHWLDHLRAQSVQGAVIRLHPAPPLHCIIVDRHAALLPRSDSAGAFLLRGHDIVQPIVALFDEIWRDGDPQPGPDDTTGSLVTEARLRQIVTLLAQGHKDEAIGRKLGLSVRTVRRLVSSAITELQAESRFQAGVEAVRRGWVS